MIKIFTTLRDFIGNLLIINRVEYSLYIFISNYGKNSTDPDSKLDQNETHFDKSSQLSETSEI
jgi:hypothetical protein